MNEEICSAHKEDLQVHLDFKMHWTSTGDYEAKKLQI